MQTPALYLYAEQTTGAELSSYLQCGRDIVSLPLKSIYSVCVEVTLCSDVDYDQLMEVLFVCVQIL